MILAPTLKRCLICSLCLFTISCSDNPDGVQVHEETPTKKWNPQKVEAADTWANTLVDDPIQAAAWYKASAERSEQWADAKAKIDVTEHPSIGSQTDWAKRLLEPKQKVLNSAKGVVEQGKESGDFPQVVECTYPFYNDFREAIYPAYGILFPVPQNVCKEGKNVKANYEKIFKERMPDLINHLKNVVSGGLTFQNTGQDAAALKERYPTTVKLAEEALQWLDTICKTEKNSAGKFTRTYISGADTEAGQKEALRCLKRAVVLLTEAMLAHGEEGLNRR